MTSVIVGTNRWRTRPPPALLERIRREGLMVDTAERYGFGQAEPIIGAHLPEVPVITKIMPWLWRSPRNFDRYLHRRLARLRRPSVSVLMLHFSARRAQRQWLSRLAAAVRNGHAGAVGLSSPTRPQLDAAIEILAREGVPLRYIQAELSLQRAAALWDGTRQTCAAHGVSLLAFRVFGAGSLFQLPPGQLQRTLADASAHTGASAAQLSVAWLRHHGVVPIIGTRSASHLDEVCADVPDLPASVRAQLDRVSQRR